MQPPGTVSVAPVRRRYAEDAVTLVGPRYAFGVHDDTFGGATRTMSAAPPAQRVPSAPPSRVGGMLQRSSWFAIGAAFGLLVAAAVEMQGGASLFQRAHLASDDPVALDRDALDLETRPALRLDGTGAAGYEPHAARERAQGVELADHPDHADRADHVERAKATGLLTVVCVPGCDQVVDGAHSLGASPVFKRTVRAGSHTLRLRGAAGEKTVSVRVTANQLTLVHEDLGH